MSKTRVMVRTYAEHTSESTVMISDSVVKRWRIPTDQYIHLRFGSATHLIRVVPIATRNELRISGSLASELGLPPISLPLRLSYKPSDKTVRIGPLIGVMIPRTKGIPGRRFGMITAFCRELTEACKLEGAFVYFFTPDDLRSTARSIVGWSMQGLEYKSSFPIPDVIYNRLPSRKLEGEPGLQQFLKEAKDSYGIYVFNEKYLDKTEVFEALRHDPKAIRYLPESHAYRNLDQIKSMCSRYRTVFLKPITGSLGKGIIRVTRTSGGYSAAISSMAGVNKFSFSSINGLVAFLSSRLRAGKFQVQQGLELIAIDNRPIDFRALAQKDINGKWVISSIVARIASSNRFVSNIAQGGSFGSVRKTITRSNMAVNRQQAYSALKQTALVIANGLEANIPYHLGELGVDLAIERASGKVWLLEVNSKPSKNDSTLPGEGRTIRPSVKRLVQYYRYLTRL